MAAREHRPQQDPRRTRPGHLVQVLHGLLHELERELGVFSEDEADPEVFLCNAVGLTEDVAQNVAPQVSRNDASATEPAHVSQNSGEAEALAAEVPAQGEEEASTSLPAGDELATNEQWAALTRHVAPSSNGVLRAARKRFPEAGLKKAADVTREQAEILIREALK